jgi:hypothetical protein
LIERRLGDADAVVVEKSETPHFVDAGSNFARVSCPGCGADLGEWWPTAMDQGYESDFVDLAVEAPCCGLATTLNDLRYDWPQAFARVSIHVMNPNVGELDRDLQHEVEGLLGVSTRVIWQHL